MTATKTRLIFLLLTISISLAAQTTDKETESKTIIKGHIVDATTGEVMPLVLVTIFFTETDYKSVRADFDGYFSIQIPNDKTITDKSNLEFIIFNYKKLVMDSCFYKTDNLKVSMAADTSRQITREEYEKLCKERYKYGE